MNLAEKRWEWHRLVTDRIGWRPPWGGRTRKWLFITERDPLCHMQYFPFWHFRRRLREQWGIEVRELPLQRFLADERTLGGPVDAVAFQTWFDLEPEAIRDLARRIRKAAGGAPLAYFDWFAPTDLRYAEPLDDLLAVYAKKQTLSNHDDYRRTTLGDTNLTDYYARRYGLEEYPPTHYPVPERFWPKLWLAPHFAFTPHMLPRFLGAYPDGERDIDLHARIAVKGTPWYTRMRQEALDRALALGQRMKVVCQGRVDRDTYFSELYRAKLCFSPFGYGEVCWRDFEAMFTGSLLLKPDMSHLACAPQSFQPGITYVPLAWDLSDLEERVDHYLTHEEERQAITREAFRQLADYFSGESFLDEVTPLLQRLNLTE